MQDMAWTEADRPARKAARSQQSSSPEQQRILNSHGLFCFETAVRLWLWALLAYRRLEVSPACAARLACAQAICMRAQASACEGDSLSVCVCVCVSVCVSVCVCVCG